CDATETSAAFARALSCVAPTAIVTSRQKLPASGLSTREGASKGGYVLSAGKKKTPDVILMASGSEVSLCMEAQKLLEEKGVSARVVSMPCMDLFAEQSAEYKESVLPKKVRARVAVEAASRICWGEYVGLDGAYVCMDRFGESAPASVLFKEFGFTAENVCNTALSVLKK
ncbi:MAG TPA: transketolase, partial [Candidatus Protoclostridium stercorigallinarum]|nr:transketolase [Candidatus Protoclostridium stercorigallinarum]